VVGIRQRSAEIDVDSIHARREDRAVETAENRASEVGGAAWDVVSATGGALEPTTPDSGGTASGYGGGVRRLRLNSAEPQSGEGTSSAPSPDNSSRALGSRRE
jgi:hypothetical protein